MNVMTRWTRWAIGVEWDKFFFALYLGPFLVLASRSALRDMQRQAQSRQGRRQGNRGVWRSSKTRKAVANGR